MEKRINRKINKSFEKTLLDSPVPNRKIKFLPSGNKSKSKSKSFKRFNSKLIKLFPEPLKPTKYVPPKPTPKPRVKPKVIPKRRVPPPIPLPNPIDKKVKKLIDEITPYYKPEAITVVRC